MGRVARHAGGRGDHRLGGAATEQRSSLARAEHAGFRQRRQLHRQAERAAEREGPLREAFERLAAPERARIAAELPEARNVSAALQGQLAAHFHFQVAHPEALHRLDRLDRDIASAAYAMDLERQGVDDIVARAPEPPEPTWGWGHEPRALERGIERGIDLGL